ncbi:MAG: 16S rRNA (cytosine(967)-C(5))-methyltransferase RsmB, partial [Gammaproteobacteria bacterium]|nr:16S rRNA (cytosine(967)-C(5))-methyltransferase RsmB [Gammaproteobacteria bacterium]
LKRKDIAAHKAPHVRHGLTLAQACPVEVLPGFAEGQVSVQDTAAQLAAELLQAKAGERILDACAAPGGKTLHIIESQPELAEMLAVDIEPERLKRIEENLQRAGLRAKLICGDGLRPEDWWDGQPFDRILLDAPCSATGVIRRHPDIKLLRRQSDIDTLVEIQRKILSKLWPLLKPGGMLLYATCSILPVENTLQIQHFLAQTGDARLQHIEGEWGQSTDAGRQILPGDDEMDGFYYACLYKSS